MELSKNRLKDLAKLKQKKYRLLEKKVVIEGLRTLQQLKDYGIKPVEQYIEVGEKPLWEDVSAIVLRDWEFQQICDSEHPQCWAALFPLPETRSVEFRRALYLDEIHDPGNLGTIFRLAAAFKIDAIFLSPGCVEVSSPKVIRSSLGSVYHIPFAVLDYSQVKGVGARLVLTDMNSGIPLQSFHPPKEEKIIIALGSEAQGISPALKETVPDVIHIEMYTEMESLNVSVAAGIIAYHLYLG